MKHRSINIYLISSLIVLFLCTIKANASEVEMGCCMFQAPDEAFAKEFNSAAEEDNPACKEDKSCIFTWILHPGNFLLTNIGDDYNKSKAVFHPFNVSRMIKNYSIQVTGEYNGNVTPSKIKPAINGWIKPNNGGKLTKMECNVSLIIK